MWQRARHSSTWLDELTVHRDKKGEVLNPALYGGEKGGLQNADEEKHTGIKVRIMKAEVEFQNQEG